MALTAILEQFSLAEILRIALTVFLPIYIIHRLYLGPLSQIPGPLICRLTSLWTYYHAYFGDECTLIDDLHKRYGPVVRIAPNEVCISDGAALAPVHTEKGGFLKAPCYKNFDIDGHSTIFSALDPAHRAVRSKPVLPMFSIGSVRNGDDVIKACVDRFIDRIKEGADMSRASKKETGRPTPCNMLNLARSLALDGVSSYLFGRTFGGVEEKTEKMSATSFVDAFVAVGRFFYLPNWIFLALELTRQRVWPDVEEDASMKKIDDFVQGLVQSSGEDDTTYQGRLMKAGISDREVKVQCEDLIFAGTDSTGMNLSTICWHLAKQPEIYARLRKEVAETDAKDPQANPQAISYLDAVIREGLRIAMANPTRLPRVVPPQGFDFIASNGRCYHIPAGTLVGLQIYSLHFNAEVFADPFAFKPERWLDTPSPEMQRDWLPFGLGQRQCIARNLASHELFLAVRAIAIEGVLEGARPVDQKIEIFEWFNSKVKGERMDLVWE